MAVSRIFTLPFCYEVRAVPVRGRVARPKLLRDSTPAMISLLSASEAPISLLARLTVDGNTTASKRIALRHDGSTYLRAVLDRPRQAGGEPRPFSIETFERMLRWEEHPWAPEHGDRDRPDGILTTRSRELRDDGAHGYDQRHRNLAPDQLLTRDQFEGTVRKWEHDGQEAARIAAIRSASEFVFVDGMLHRRVGAPFVAATKEGYPGLFHADQYEERFRAYGAEANFVAVQSATVLMGLPRGPYVPPFHFKIDAPLESNCPAALAFAVRSALPQLRDAVELALPEMSAPGMEAFRRWRASYTDAVEGDFDACLKALEALRALVNDETLFGGERTRKFHELARPKVSLLDTIARENGFLPIFDIDAERLLGIV